MKINRQMVRIGIILIVAVVGYFQTGKFNLGKSSNSGASAPSSERQTSAPSVSVGSDKTTIKNAKIRDMDGSIAYQGDVDLKPTLERIKSGKSHSHKNDGSVFGNRERRLPSEARGYYREYVVPTKGIRHAGPQRLVIGKGGEVYYTGDHYKSFTRINQ